MLSKAKKQKAIKGSRRHETDTGSPEVQEALLTRRMEGLSKHLKKHRKDLHSRRGLLGIVERRRKLSRAGQKKKGVKKTATKKAATKKTTTKKGAKKSKKK